MYVPSTYYGHLLQKRNKNTGDKINYQKKILVRRPKRN